MVKKYKKVFIIAEAGVNHNGSLTLAKKLVDAALYSGADAVKFQTFKAAALASRHAPKAEYQNRRGLSYKTQFDMLKSLELSDKEFARLFDYCRKKKIVFLSTPFDTASAVFLKKLGVSCFKISSGDLTNTPFIIDIAKYGKPVILSTGMSSMTEVKEAVGAVYSTGNRKLTLLHCTSNYPAGYSDVNLRAMVTMKNTFDLPVGYSDHTSGIEISVAAVALGASIIEKHITLDKAMKGPDHHASLTAREFKTMAQAIRNVSKALGSPVKAAARSELEMRKVARKSVVAACDISRGCRIEDNMLAVKRPGTGIEPKHLDRLIGMKSKRFIGEDEVIRRRDVG